MYGWVGTILRVDLSSRQVEKEPLSEELRRNYIGGRGINSRILYDEVKPGINPLGPENRLIFGTGPLTGTLIANGRFTVTAKSPTTNILGDANAGGHFSPELKYAGYDHIVFKGKAEKPVYLWIDDDHVEIREAGHLWGETTDETDRLIKEELGDPRIQVACIGPGGENLVFCAVIVCNVARVAGRTGMGRVMGSKNLKAIAVRGTKGIKIADPETFRALALDLQQRIMRNPRYAEQSVYGTSLLGRTHYHSGRMGIKNALQMGEWKGIDEIQPETFKKRFFTKSRSCFGCPIHCSHWFEIKEGPYAGEQGEGIEYGTTGAWGPLCDNSYAPSLFKIGKLCNQYGLCGLESGIMMAAAIDWYERGLITKEDTEGIELEWGNYEAMIAMLHKMARREGFGDVLAESPLSAAERVGKGAEECISTVKGAFALATESRIHQGRRLSYAVGTRGADHLRGLGESAVPEEIRRKLDPDYAIGPSYKAKAWPVYYSQGVYTITDALEICKFGGPEAKLKDMAELFFAATGMKVDEKDLREIADRIWTVERAFSVREGITRKDDIIVGRRTDEPVPSGPFKGYVHNQKKWDMMLDEYYDLVGWDKKTGAPTRAKLEALGLNEIAAELEAMGKL